MTPSGALWVSVRKEARALWLPWAACAATLAAVARLAHPQFIVEGWFVYFMGSAALAAVAIGHEYTHGTLPLLLSLPVDRRRLLLVKIGVVVPMLAALGAGALLVLPADPDFERGPIPILSMLCALLLAPWLTMLCRGPLAGVMFAFAITALLHVAAQAITKTRYGWDADTLASHEGFRGAVLLWSLLGACAFAAVAGWRRFMQLEAIDGGDPAVPLPRWLRRNTVADSAATRPGARQRRPLWGLAMKELRLQHLTSVLAGLYAVLWLAVSTLWRGDAEALDTVAVVGTVYFGLHALLIGSIASAQERQMGTHEWQALLPIAAWKAWAVKAGIVLGLALLVSFGVPVLLAAGEMRISAFHLGTIVILTTGGLYVSTLCNNGLRAFVIAAPVMLGVVGLLLRSLFDAARPGLNALPVVMVAGMVALALRFAFENHRAARPDPTRVIWQVAWMTAAAGAAVILARFGPYFLLTSWSRVSRLLGF